MEIREKMSFLFLNWGFFLLCSFLFQILHLEPWVRARRVPDQVGLSQEKHEGTRRKRRERNPGRKKEVHREGLEDTRRNEVSVSFLSGYLFFHIICSVTGRNSSDFEGGHFQHWGTRSEKLRARKLSVPEAPAEGTYSFWACNFSLLAPKCFWKWPNPKNWKN